jgi:putative (di)nucleoside polyphosphate hydrolase
MTDDIDKDGFRANVGIVLTDGDGRLFWGRRVGRRGWQFPQGGIGAGEEPQVAMYRELEEEVGLSPDAVRLVGSSQSWMRYRLPERYRRRDSVPLCIGQKQRWFLLELVADDSAVDLAASEKPEFDQWRWHEDYWAPAKEVIFFKRHVYEQALDEFQSLVFPDVAPPKPEWLLRREAGRGGGRGTPKRRD